jgi:hypothetical protein
VTALILVAIMLSFTVSACSQASRPSTTTVPTGASWLLIKNPRFGDVPSEPEYVWVEENKVPTTLTTLLRGKGAIIATPDIVDKYGTPPGAGTISSRQGLEYARTYAPPIVRPAPCVAAERVKRPPPDTSFTAPRHAQKVELASGERIEGLVKEITQTVVVLEVAGQPLVLPREKVRSIQLMTRRNDTYKADGGCGSP